MTATDWRALAVDLAEKSHLADTYDVCTCSDAEGSADDANPCDACRAGIAWRHAVADADLAPAGDVAPTPDDAP